MFAQPRLAQSLRSSMAGAYRSVAVSTGVDGASSHQLIQMLFDGCLDAIARARGALAAGEIEAKCKAVSHAVRIVEEGLKGGLNLRDGGSLAADLEALYSYVAVRLTQANLHNDDQALTDCARLIEPLREAWRSIGRHPDTQAGLH